MINFNLCTKVLKQSIKKQKKTHFNVSNLFKGLLKTSYIKGIKDSHEYEKKPSKIADVAFMMLKFQFPEKGIFNKSQN